MLSLVQYVASKKRTERCRAVELYVLTHPQPQSCNCQDLDFPVFVSIPLHIRVISLFNGISWTELRGFSVERRALTESNALAF